MKKNNPQILILVGIPASGKSTWSKEHIRRNPDWVRINRDDYRLMLKDAQMCDPKIESMISELVTVAIRKSLARKLNVIVDATNLRAKYINEFVNEFKHEADISFRIFDISLAKAIERDNGRAAKVGEAVIKKMYENYKILVDSYAFQPVKMTPRPHKDPVGERNLKLPNAYIFDLDGTLAHHNGKRDIYDWKMVGIDDVDSVIARQLLLHHKNGDKIIIVSGRDEICKQNTLDWLEYHELPIDEIFMRPEGSFKKDNIIKRDIYENEIKDRYNVLGVYDDRDQVVEMWRKIGLKCFQVEYGNF